MNPFFVAFVILGVYIFIAIMFGLVTSALGMWEGTRGKNQILITSLVWPVAMLLLMIEFFADIIVSRFSDLLNELNTKAIEKRRRKDREKKERLQKEAMRRLQEESL